MNKGINKRIKLLSELTELTMNHNWHYANSNDPEVYSVGLIQASKIQLLVEECNNNNMSILAKDIYNEYKPK